MGNCGYFNKYVHIPDWNEHSRQLNQSPLTIYPALLAIFEALNRKETICQGQRDRSFWRTSSVTSKIQMPGNSEKEL